MTVFAADYARAYHIAPQRKDETDIGFRERVGTELRRRGRLISACEAYFDEGWHVAGGQVLPAVFGATANDADQKPPSLDADIIRGTLLCGRLGHPRPA